VGSLDADIHRRDKTIAIWSAYNQTGSMAMARRCITARMGLILVLSTSILGLGHGRAWAAMILTPAAVAEGFQLTTFATGFPTDSDEANGTAGPLGIVFPTSGGVLVTDAPGNVRLLPTDSDGQNASSVTPAQSLGHNNAAGLAQLGSSIYMTEQSLGRVVQLNPDGTVNQLIVNLPGATGIVADPITGHLFVSVYSANTIYDVNPAAKSATLFLSNVPTPDGLSLSPDGKTLYVAAVGDAGGHILGFDTTSKNQVFDSGGLSGVDGTALGTGVLAGNIFGNTNFGQFVEVNLTTSVQTVIGTAGTRGDFVAVDPSNGSLLITQTNEVLRISIPNGGFGPPVPEPTSWVLMGIGLLGILGSIYRLPVTRS
jgi:hypothetical protein